MMKKTTAFSRGVTKLAIFGLFAFVLGSFLIPLSRANAQVVMVTGNIVASPGTICAGESAQISWSSTNATTITIDPGIGSVSAYGERDVSPTQTTTYTLNLSNSTGGYGTTSATVYVSGNCQQNPTVNLTANPSSINSGGSSTLSWTSTNATSCTASGGSNGWSGSKNTSGNFPTGSLTNTTTYNITCTNGSGQSANDSATVTVSGQQSPTVTISANPTRIDSGDDSRITWSSSNATSCTASGGRNGWSGSRNLSGTFNTGALFNDTTYTITCSNSHGSDSDSVTVRVDDDDDDDDDVRVTISADRTSISRNESTIVRWRPENADSCRGTGGANGWSGRRSTSRDDFRTGPLSRTTTFTITCENDDDSDSDSVTIRVGDDRSDSELTAITNPATSITTSSAQLNALVLNSSTGFVNDFATAWFEWGPTFSLGNRTPATSIGSLPSVRHSSFLTGLSSGTTYYFRVIAENASDRAVGSILSFTTTGRGTVFVPPPAPRTGAAILLINSSIDRSQPIVPTLDNSRPEPGDEINYTVTYQNVGTASVTGAVLQLNLPYEVDYLFSTPSTPRISGNTLTFNIGTVRPNTQGTVTVRVRVREDIRPGTDLNFPATLTYIDPSGFPQSVSANVTAEVWDEDTQSFINLGANVFGAGFFPDNIFGWLLLILLILALIMLFKHLFSQPLTRKTTIVNDHPLGKKTTTTTIE